MRIAIAIACVACASCDGVLGLRQTVAADATRDAADPDPGLVGMPCDALAFDPLRFRGLDGGSAGLTAPAALAQCAIYGMQLVSFDANDAAELTNEINGASFYFWTGLDHASGAWANPDGCLPADLWRAGEPSSSYATDCGLMTTDNVLAASCGEAIYGTAGPINALCETPRPSTACIAQQSQRMYRPITSPLSYTAAASACNAPNEHLVEIDSSDELAAVRQVAARAGLAAYWVGATYAANQWTSPTGCPQVFGWSTAAVTPDLAPCVVDNPSTGGMYTTGCAAGGISAMCETNP